MGLISAGTLIEKELKKNLEEQKSTITIDDIWEG